MESLYSYILWEKLGLGAETYKIHEKDYPGIEDPSKFIQETDEVFMEQYHPAWSPVFYKDDPDFLFIDLHY